MRDEIRAAIAPAVEAFVDGLVELLSTHFDDQVDAAIEITRAALEAFDVDQGPRSDRSTSRTHAVGRIRNKRDPRPNVRRGRIRTSVAASPTTLTSTTPATGRAADPRPPQTPRVDRQPSPASSPSTSSPPPTSLSLLSPALAPTSKRQSRAIVQHEPPPGWTPELDRIEELLAESELIAWKKTHG